MIDKNEIKSESGSNDLNDADCLDNNSNDLTIIKQELIKECDETEETKDNENTIAKTKIIVNTFTNEVSEGIKESELKIKYELGGNDDKVTEDEEVIKQELVDKEIKFMDEEILINTVEIKREIDSDDVNDTNCLDNNPNEFLIKQELFKECEETTLNENKSTETRINENTFTNEIPEGIRTEPETKIKCEMDETDERVTKDKVMIKQELVNEEIEFVDEEDVKIVFADAECLKKVVVDKTLDKKCDKEITDIVIKNKKFPNFPRKQECSICKKIFKSRAAVTIHYMEHTSKPFYCKKCNLLFNFESYSKHPCEKVLFVACYVCGARYGSMRDLNIHKTVAHNLK